MSDNDCSAYTSEEETSDDENDVILPARAENRQRDIKRSNLFFATHIDANDAIRSNQIYKRNYYEKGLTKDKRTTVQHVLDKRTYVRLRKLCGQGVFHYMHGTISTGKEANVFEAETLQPETVYQKENGAFEEEDKTALDDEDGIDGDYLSSISTASKQGDIDGLTNNLESLDIASGSGSSLSSENGNLIAQKYMRVAIKVYKTSILVFKDRSRYIEGEFRFRNAYVGNKNPRKMVAQWAEKEFRNLRRIALSGLYCPAPIALKDHILVMDLILNGDSVAPKLENLGALPLVEWQSIYVQTLCIMRTMFQECKLIHGDLSSFNLLYSKGRVNVIDTSQALENDHPNAMPFLKRDCDNVTRFFESVNIIQECNDETLPYSRMKMLTSEQLFCFVVARDLEGVEINEDSDLSIPLTTTHQSVWDDEATVDIKSFWETKYSDIENEVAQCVEKMTRFNKFGTSKDIKSLIVKKRVMYLNLCNAVFNFLTGSVFSNENIKSHIPWLKRVNFDKSLPMNISQMPLDLAESVATHKDNVIIQLNDISHDVPSEDSSIHSDEGISDDETHEIKTENEDDVNGKTIDAAPKFTGNIPEGIDPREWKKLVKAFNRERRKNKIPKHIKKKYGTSKK
ncbi:RIO1 serine/threonine kinase family protein [Babesia bovis T2Bo]|uniref:non-specific serine/threonine protein kinase n=1 Tax=Babesia bovis TaxID=5865 RepID=A7ART1_BABBO|nr:RIO1 serine/threonine kinase family protein [Babesia bovis T2Bo]EDO07250.1 RIO1 serine/threonine kinase family protein [Babesia bovis T2Bo]|eukprot:XP_001610818.1 serine/threonine protein kinase [Babesia bovis T2Bo]